MKIAVIGGSYDPVQLGHVYLIEQACKIADEVHVLIGPNPTKTYTFTLTERADMLALSIAHTKAVVQILDLPTTVEYCQRLIVNMGIGYDDLTIVRGVRDARDLEYEQNIERCMKHHDPNLNFFYVFAPDRLRNVSSSAIKDLCIRKGYEAARNLVPAPVFPHLSKLLKDDDRNPMTCHSAKDGAVDCFEKQKYVVFGKMKDFFKQAVAAGFFKYAEEVDEHQVRCMLDETPLDLVVSKKFKLMEVETRRLRPTGRQYLPCSQSLGPIIVEANEVLSKHPVYTLPLPGPVIVIEGKHRWIEAIERGDERILAWVGEKAVPLLASAAPLPHPTPAKP